MFSRGLNERQHSRTASPAVLPWRSAVFRVCRRGLDPGHCGRCGLLTTPVPGERAIAVIVAVAGAATALLSKVVELRN
jgi:hypothetical protein